MSLAQLIQGKGTAGSVANVATVAVANPPTPKTVFSEVDHSGIESGQVATATLATTATHDPAELPADLIEAATRCCVEIHNDGPEGVAAMLDDLLHYPPASWPWLADHFRRQLPGALADGFSGKVATLISCGDCRHGIATVHPAIVTCGLGIPSGLPINGRWSTDRHGCEGFDHFIGMP